MVAFSAGEFRSDSLALGGLFQDIINEKTGLGTSRDKATHNSLQVWVPRLSPQEMRGLPRQNRLVRRIINLYPDSAYEQDFQIIFSGDRGEEKDKTPDLLKEYLYEVKGNSNLWSLFKLAGSQARQNGDAFILVGVADGKREYEPVDENNIESIQFFKLVTRWDIRPEYYKGDPLFPEYYHLNLNYSTNSILELPLNFQKRNSLGRKWHRSRVLRISGDFLSDPDAIRENNGYHDSVLNSMLSAYINWKASIEASSSILQDYNFFTLGMAGLSEALNQDKAKNSTEKQSELLRRAKVLDQGRSIIQGVMYDLEEEKIDTVSRNFSGADKIIDRLDDLFSASSGIPKYKLYNLIGSQGLTSSTQMALILRSQWALLVQDWASNVYGEPLEQICKLAMLAKDSPTKGKLPDRWEIIFPFSLKLTPSELAELQKTVSETDSKNIAAGIYTAQEARKRYERLDFSPDLLLEPLTAQELQKKDKEQQGQEQDSTLNGHQPQDDPSHSEERNDFVLRSDDATPAKKIIQWQGFKIGIQHFPHTKRHPKGRPLPCSYGHFQKTRSPYDQMAIDCYVGSKLDSAKAFAIAQHIDGEFDEEKIIIGVDDQNEAIRLYLMAMPSDFFGGIRELPLEELRGYRMDAVSDKVLSDEEWEQLSKISAADFVSVAEGILELDAEMRADACAKIARDKRGRFAGCAVGGGNSGGGSRSGGGGMGETSLKAKKVAELKDLAKQVGATEPSKYRNRKSSWIEAIQAAQTGNKGDKKVTGRKLTEAELRTKKVAELKDLAKQVGATEPTKYRNRKSSWIETIQAVQSKEKESKPAALPKTTNKTTSLKRNILQSDYKQIKNLGKQFTIESLDKSLALGKLTAEEKRALKNRDNILKEMNDNPQDKSLITKARVAVDKYNKLVEERNAREDQAFKGLLGKIIQLNGISRQQADKMVEKVKLGDNLSPVEKEMVKAHLSSFFMITGGKAAGSIKLIDYLEPRAYASSEKGLVNTGIDVSRRVLWHEFAHHIEYSNQNIKAAAGDWRNNKANSPQPEWLGELTGNKSYAKNERALPDDFVSPYVGKIYGRSGYTEVISMGIERFSSVSSMKEFYRKDPDHFNFIAGVLLAQ